MEGEALDRNDVMIIGTAIVAAIIYQQEQRDSKRVQRSVDKAHEIIGEVMGGKG